MSAAPITVSRLCLPQEEDTRRQCRTLRSCLGQLLDEVGGVCCLFAGGEGGCVCVFLRRPRWGGSASHAIPEMGMLHKRARRFSGSVLCLCISPTVEHRQ